MDAIVRYQSFFLGNGEESAMSNSRLLRNLACVARPGIEMGIEMDDCDWAVNLV